MGLNCLSVEAGSGLTACSRPIYFPLAIPQPFGYHGFSSQREEIAKVPLVKANRRHTDIRKPRPQPAQDDFLPSPFTIIRDTREQHPWTFHGLSAGKVNGCRPILALIDDAYLESGDYSIENYESIFAIERKSLPDLYQTVIKGRDRFKAELARLEGFDFACVIIEASWNDILFDPPENTLIEPLAVYESIISFSLRFKTKWFCAGGRADAERLAYSLMYRFWKHKQEEKS